MGEIFRSFALALTTLTSIFVLIMVMSEAAKIGLSPVDILNLIPAAIPGTLPYSVPVSLLFAVTVIFGRIAADNEVIAIKAAGLSAWTVLWPALSLGAILSGLILYAGANWIPNANYRVKLVIFKNTEEMFYKFLKKDRSIDNKQLPFLITVSDVVGKRLIDPHFMHRVSKEDPDTYDSIIHSKSAIIKFVPKEGIAKVYLEKAEVLQTGNVMLIDDEYLPIDMVGNGNPMQKERTQEYTTSELVVEQANMRAAAENDRKKLAIEMALNIASGRVNRLQWRPFQFSQAQRLFRERRINEFETEKQLRFSISFGSLFFVLLGAPVGIIFAKRDFLSAFITCFLPIILIYYPLMLFGVNLGREGLYDPAIVLWVPNVILVVLFGAAIRPVVQH
jgi:lipopolysaccharide export system permease protein